MAKQKHLIMDLQLFAEGDNTQPQPPADPAAQALAMLQAANTQPEGAALPGGQPQPTVDSNPQNSPQGSENGGQSVQPNNQPTEDGQPGQQAQPTPDMVLGKFKSTEELANGYVNLERGYTQTRQELAQARQVAEAAQAAVQQMQEQMNNIVNPPQQEPQLSPEEMNEQLMARFYDNPAALFNEIKEQAKNELMKEIQPMQQSFQAHQRQNVLNQAMNQFAQQTPDFEQFGPAVSEILAKNPELTYHPGGPQAAVNIAYQMAKGQQYQDPGAIVNDQNFVENYIMKNPDILNKVLQYHMQDVQKNNNAPTVIAGQAGGQTPAMPKNEPQTIQEARGSALEMLRR